MSRTKHCLVALIAVSAMGCHSDMEVREKGASDTRPVSSTNPPGSSAAVSTPVQSPAASTAISTAHSGQGAITDSGSYTEVVGQEGVVDWTAGIVTASGIGFPPADALNGTQARLLAKRAAQSVAYRNLLEAFTAVRVDSTTTVKNYVTTSDEIQVKVQGMVEDAKIIHERQLEKGGYEVTLQMKLTGRVSETFVPKNAPPVKRLVAETLTTPSPKSGMAYTGLVVDARGTGVRPALVPRILTEDGQEAYSQSYVLAKYRQNQGIAAYVSDPAAAKTHPKVTDNPLYVKALRPAGNSQTDLVISNAAAQTIHGVKDHFEFLEKAQVILIVDRAGSS